MFKRILLVLVCLSFALSTSSFANDDNNSGGSGGPKSKPPGKTVGTQGHGNNG